ncbi:carotenoid oxygenase family protein [Streptomyces sp. NPDC051109]|uniref:carotenoid oxygenase family protein n=1 Tax=Streptomyces sp. NPDC051109 TaxID=3365642 RepID=UPI0037B48F3F
MKYDRARGSRQVHEVGDARLPGEAVFVPAAGGTREDDGYLLTVVSDLKQNASRLLVLDASGLDRIAAVHLPRRVTAGIHGSWMIPDSALDAGRS